MLFCLFFSVCLPFMVKKDACNSRFNLRLDAIITCDKPLCITVYKGCIAICYAVIPLGGRVTHCTLSIVCLVLVSNSRRKALIHRRKLT